MNNHNDGWARETMLNFLKCWYLLYDKLKIIIYGVPEAIAFLIMDCHWKTFTLVTITTINDLPTGV